MPPIAAKAMAWQRRLGAIPGPLGASGESSTGDPVTVEMYLSGQWTDVTGFVMVRDENGNITITRGRRDEGSTTEQSTCTLILNNRDGRWSPRYPAGLYYGIIGRNTPVRVSVPDGLGGKSYRFQGEVSVWPQSWDPTGTDIWTEVEGNGILRRLSQGPASAHSVMYDTISSPFSPSLRAYWPCEDPADSLSVSTPLTTGSPMTFSGAPQFASYNGFPSADPVLTMDGTTLSGNVGTYGDPTATQVRFLCYMPPDGLPDGKVLISIDQVDYSAGSPQFFEMYYSASSHSFTFHTMSSDGSNLGADLPHNYDVRGKLMYVSIELQENGTGTNRAIRLYDVTSQNTYSVSDLENLTQLSPVTKIQFGPATRSVAGPVGSAFIGAVALGHITLEDAITPITAYGVHLNPIGENAGRRIQRICTEEGIAFEYVGDLDDTVDMGIQAKLNPLSLMQECELADDGMLYESMPNLGLGYRTRGSLLNQEAQLTLDYAGFNLSQIPTPVEDDRYIQNKVTVTVDQISETYELTVGDLSTQLPPTGVGVYGQEVTLNLASSGDALSQAAWRVHLGTVDEPRYPAISVNLAHSTFVNNPLLKQAVLRLKQGDRILVQNPPFWLPPGNIDQIILGFDETITHFEHRITFICAPASPYRVGVLDSTAAVIDTDGSMLTADATSNATSLSVSPWTGLTGLWTTDSTNMPIDLSVGGEVVRVTSITPSVTDTFTRTTANGWGNADSGQAWTLSGGANSDHSTNGTLAIHTMTSINTSRYDTLNTTVSDFDVRCDFATSVTALGDNQYAGIVTRFTDVNNVYYARLTFTPTQTVSLYLQKRVNGGQSDMASVTTALTHVANTFYTLRFQLAGNTLRAKTWLQGTPEPPSWDVTAVDTALIGVGAIGVRSILGSGNTNTLPVTISMDNFQLLNPQTFTVTRSINGVVKPQTAGTDIRLANPTIISL